MDPQPEQKLNGLPLISESTLRLRILEHDASIGQAGSFLLEEDEFYFEGYVKSDAGIAFCAVALVGVFQLETTGTTPSENGLHSSYQVCLEDTEYGDCRCAECDAPHQVLLQTDDLEAVLKLHQNAVRALRVQTMMSVSPASVAAEIKEEADKVGIAAS